VGLGDWFAHTVHEAGLATVCDQNKLVVQFQRHHHQANPQRGTRDAEQIIGEHRFFC